MCISTRLYVYIYMFVCVYLHVCMCISTRLYVYIYTFVCVSLSIFINLILALSSLNELFL